MVRAVREETSRDKPDMISVQVLLRTGGRSHLCFIDVPEKDVAAVLGEHQASDVLKCKEQTPIKNLITKLFMERGPSDFLLQANKDDLVIVVSPDYEKSQYEGGLYAFLQLSAPTGR